MFQSCECVDLNIAPYIQMKIALSSESLRRECEEMHNICKERMGYIKEKMNLLNRCVAWDDMGQLR